MENSGFLIKAPTDDVNSDFEDTTPEDLADLGYVYVPAVEAPLELLKCMDRKESKIIKNFHGLETIVLFGGLDGTVRFQGVGLTPAGKEDEAVVGQMLASQIKAEPPDSEFGECELVELIRRTAVWERNVGKDEG